MQIEETPETGTEETPPAGDEGGSGLDEPVPGEGGDSGADTGTDFGDGEEE